MLADIEAGKVGTVIVKDMSRLGRNYLQVGMYTEMVFPQKGVRFIAINDGVDSAQGDNDFAPLRNIFNEWLVRDTSKKIKAVKRSKGMSGKPITSKPVYGYLMDEDENFIIDEEAAPVVKQIYNLCLAGNGPTKIARMLTEQQIPTPGSGESVEVRDRLALDGKKAGGYFNQQIVEPIAGKNGPLGYLRLTLDTHTLATEAQQVDNTTNILRLMLLLSLAIGVVLTRTLLQGKRTRWQQSPFLLTASKPVPEEEESEKKE